MPENYKQGAARSHHGSTAFPPWFESAKESGQGDIPSTRAAQPAHPAHPAHPAQAALPQWRQTMSASGRNPPRRTAKPGPDVPAVLPAWRQTMEVSGVDPARRTGRPDNKENNPRTNGASLAGPKASNWHQTSAVSFVHSTPTLPQPDNKTSQSKAVSSAETAVVANVQPTRQPATKTISFVDPAAATGLLDTLSGNSTSGTKSVSFLVLTPTPAQPANWRQAKAVSFIDPALATVVSDALSGTEATASRSVSFAEPGDVTKCRPANKKMEALQVQAQPIIATKPSVTQPPNRAKIELQIKVATINLKLESAQAAHWESELQKYHSGQKMVHDNEYDYNWVNEMLKSSQGEIKKLNTTLSALESALKKITG